MLRSLFSGISGLRAHQTMLDVTGNNIANVNTTGFKSSQTQFQDTLSQVLQNAGGAQEGTGGTNPAQVGLGVQVAGVTTNFTQGAAQLTGRSTDMMISGDGFFVVRSGTETLYTRAGAFDFDANGNLVTPEGGLVQGWAAVNGAVDTNGPLTDLRLPIGTVMGSRATATASFEGNLPSSAVDGTVLDRQITIYDALGNASELYLRFTKDAGANTWTLTHQTVPAGAPLGTTWASGGTVTFAATAPTAPATTPAIGDIIAPTVTPPGATDAIPGITVTPTAVPGGPTPTAITVDLSGVTGFAGLQTIEAATQDGQGAGTLQSFEINADGTLMGSFSNGLKQAIGQVALGTFTNPSGLSKAGGSLYRTTVNSGEAQIGTAGTAGRGTLAGGALEMSNVDLSQEFTNLIIAQRGFQANSRVITTSDEVLQELSNLKR